jgi:hypothetical protein
VATSDAEKSGAEKNDVFVFMFNLMEKHWVSD